MSSVASSMPTTTRAIFSRTRSPACCTCPASNVMFTPLCPNREPCQWKRPLTRGAAANATRACAKEVVHSTIGRCPARAPSPCGYYSICTLPRKSPGCPREGHPLPPILAGFGSCRSARSRVISPNFRSGTPRKLTRRQAAFGAAQVEPPPEAASTGQAFPDLPAMAKCGPGAVP